MSCETVNRSEYMIRNVHKQKAPANNEVDRWLMDTGVKMKYLVQKHTTMSTPHIKDPPKNTRHQASEQLCSVRLWYNKLKFCCARVYLVHG